MSTFLFLSTLIFCSVSIYFVYAMRGEARYASFSEYIRKGWPIFSPFNCFLYLFTKEIGKKPILDIKDFPELREIQKNWKEIAIEANNLKNHGFFQQTTNEDSSSYYDLGFRTFYKYGWSKFYLTWYGHSLNSAKKYCPKTVELLENSPLVNGSMLTLLPVGSKLTRHLDPIASSLRLHISLDTPNDPKCFINVDGNTYFWKDGDAFLFDETYLHFVENETNKDRLILMCDIDRPLYFPANVLNKIGRMFMYASIVPNLPGDKRGLVNRIFFRIAPIISKMKNLKSKNIILYKLIKYSINLTLFSIVIGGVYKSIVLFRDIFSL